MTQGTAVAGRPARRTIGVAAVAILTAILAPCAGPNRGAPSFQAAPDLVITNARIVDGTGERLSATTIEITDGRITWVGDRSRASGPAEVLDAGGNTVIPGLIDAHVHLLTSAGAEDEERLERFMADSVPAILLAYLRRGVTSVKSTGDPFPYILELRDAVARGDVPGPRIVATGPVFTGVGGHPAGTVRLGSPSDWCRRTLAREPTSATEAWQAVDALAQAGVDGIKVVFSEGGRDWPLISEIVLRAVIERAHMRRLPVVAHTWTEDEALFAAAAGVDGLEHGVAVGSLRDDTLADLLASSGASYVPTMRVGGAPASWDWPSMSDNTERMAAAGVRIVLGSDAAGGRRAHGSSTIEEAVLLGRALRPAAVIEAGTLAAAEHLGLEDVGRIAAGYRADLAILDEDPLADLAALWSVRAVVRAGKLLRLDLPRTPARPKGLP